MSKRNLPLGKLPAPLLSQLLESIPIQDPQVVMGPGIGLDCAAVEHGDKYLVFKSDPITFTADDLGWYLVQVNANDIATTGGRPRWLLVTLFLPMGLANDKMAADITGQIVAASNDLGITVIGGHTEITYGIDRPIGAGTLVGEVEKSELITPQGAKPGHHLLLTKGMAIEATAIAAREFPDQLRSQLEEGELEKATGYVNYPGISVLRDAQTAMTAGRISAMHDPTEGGIAAALWELANACGCAITVDKAKVPITPLSKKICRILGIDPFKSISSGALLMTVPAQDGAKVVSALAQENILCADIGRVVQGPPAVWDVSSGSRKPMAWPERDEIARLLES